MIILYIIPVAIFFAGTILLYRKKLPHTMFCFFANMAFGLFVPNICEILFSNQMIAFTSQQMGNLHWFCSLSVWANGIGMLIPVFVILLREIKYSEKRQLEQFQQEIEELKEALQKMPSKAD